MKTFTVNREHEGDRFYRSGDEREAEPQDVAHLVDMGVLTLKPDEAAAPPAERKRKPKS